MADREKLKRLLLELLNEKEIADKIISITRISSPNIATDNSAEMKGELDRANAKNEELRKRLAQLEHECDALRSKNDETASENDRLCEMNIEVKSELERLAQKNCELKAQSDELSRQLKKARTQTDAAVSELEYIKRLLGGQIELYQRYLALPETERSGLRNIICDADVARFVASCSKIKTLESLWETIKSDIFNDSSQELVDTLTAVFTFFFDLFNSSSSEPLYIVDDVKVGDTFDDDIHIRCLGGRVSGKVSEIKLRGYRAAATKNPIKKSLVLVG